MKKNPVASKVALITGAARRVGAEIARILHAASMNIVVHYNESKEAAMQLCEDLNKKRDHSAVAIHAAFKDPESEKMLIQKAFSVWERLDVLINNASKFHRTFIGKTSDYAWDEILESNLKAPFFLSQAAIPYLAEHQGVIINITDIHAEHPLRDYSVYCMAKSGLSMMTKALAKELGPKKIRVNAVAPGAILWPEGENTLSEDEKQKIIHHIPLGHIGKPEDIAKAVLFFVCDAEYVTGQVLFVDGGRFL